MATDTDPPEVASPDVDDSSDGRTPGLVLVVWGVGIVVTLLGLLVTLAGLVVLGLADRTRIEELVAEGTIQGEGLSDPELVDLSLSLLWWGGIGLAVTGVLFVVAGVGFLVYQRRVGRRADADGVGVATRWTAALLGAFVTILASFLPASSLLGGGVAGYLRGGDAGSGAMVGGLAGVLAAIPMAVLLGFVLTGLALGLPDASEFGGRAILGAIFAIVTLFTVVLTVVLSGAGGAIGGYLSGDRAAEA